MRLKSGRRVPCLPLAGPAVVALNGTALPSSPGDSSPIAGGAGSEGQRDDSLSGPLVAGAGPDRAGDPSLGDDPDLLADLGLSPAAVTRAGVGAEGLPSMPLTRPGAPAHACIGAGCSCMAGGGGAASRAAGLMSWIPQDSRYAAGDAVRPSTPVPWVTLREDEFAVLDLWAPFDTELSFEPEAMEQCACLEVPVRRADGVGLGATARAHFEEDRVLWTRYEYIAGGAMCLRE